MHYFSTVAGIMAFIATSKGASHDIVVGNNAIDVSNLVFTPNTTEAVIGDTIVFHFYPGGHNVVQGSFSSPCQPLAGGFYSGFINSGSGEAKEKFVVVVNDTNPIWVYCSEVKHCELGMVAVINPLWKGDTLAAYAAGAAKSEGSVTPEVVSGGTFLLGEESTSSSTTVVTSSTSTAGTSSTKSAKPIKSSSMAAGYETGQGVVPSAIGAVLALAAAWAGLI